MGVPVRTQRPLDSVREYCRTCRDTADLLNRACAVDDFRRALAMQRRLWTALRNTLDSPGLPLTGRERRALRDDAAFILGACQAAAGPCDQHVEAFITINRRTARLLAAHLTAEDRRLLAPRAMPRMPAAARAPSPTLPS